MWDILICLYLQPKFLFSGRENWGVPFSYASSTLSSIIIDIEVWEPEIIDRGADLNK
jgi:hypothetical protein